MEKIYFLIIGMVCLIVIQKALKAFNKNDISEEIIINSKNTIDTNVDIASIDNIDTIQVFENKTLELGKNKWLYPQDEFGEIIEGVVYNSKTFKNTSISLNEKANKMKIITVKKKQQ